MDKKITVDLGTNLKIIIKNEINQAVNVLRTKDNRWTTVELTEWKSVGEGERVGPWHTECGACG